MKRQLSIILSASDSGSFSEERIGAFWSAYNPVSNLKGGILAERFMLASEGKYRVFYTPIGAVPEPEACVVFVGLTPGLSQAQRAAELFRDTPSAIRSDAVAYSRLLETHVAFAGSMRTNLCRMFDDLGLPQYLCAPDSDALFQNADGTIATTSALLYPVFQDASLDNFSGTVDLTKSALFREMITALLAPRLAITQKALIVPLGSSANSGVQYLVSLGLIESDRVLRGFPHPSGSNGHRKKHFEQHKVDLRAQLTRWARTRAA